jgi:hypothetical protein
VKEIRDTPYLNMVFEALEREDTKIWIPGYYGKWVSIHKLVINLIESDSFNKFIIFIVLANTITLGMEGMQMSQRTLDSRKVVSEVFTWIFIVEMFFKLIGMGFKGKPPSDLTSSLRARLHEPP